MRCLSRRSFGTPSKPPFGAFGGWFCFYFLFHWPCPNLRRGFSHGARNSPLLQAPVSCGTQRSAGYVRREKSAVFRKEFLKTARCRARPDFLPAGIRSDSCPNGRFGRSGIVPLRLWLADSGSRSDGTPTKTPLRSLFHVERGFPPDGEGSVGSPPIFGIRVGVAARLLSPSSPRLSRRKEILSLGKRSRPPPK